MSTIVISPYSQKMRPGATSETNPKNYPCWEEVVDKLNKVGVSCVQIGVTGEKKLEGVSDFKTGLSLDELSVLVQSCDAWTAVDNFFPHFCKAKHPEKPGVVIWGKSDPLIFGYEHNTNLLKDRKFLRHDQYDIWEKEAHEPQVFVSAKKVKDAIMKLLKKEVMS